MVASTLPSWDATILNAKDGPAWSATLDHARVLKAMRDEPIDPGTIAPNARRIENKGRVMRLEPETGRVRYFNRGRAWSPTAAGAALDDEQAAATVVHDAVAALGLPAAELGRLRVDTQVAQGGAAGTAPTETHEVYRVISVSRVVNGLPVSGSRVRAAVTRGSAIQRIGIQWPTFIMPEGLKLRARETVVTQIAEAVLRQGAVPADKPFLTARLAYAPERHTRAPKSPVTIAEDDNPRATGEDHDEAATDAADAKEARYPSRKRHTGEIVHYVPVVIVSVLAGETPYQLAIPVAE